jgi:hypothetical protein
MGYWKQLVANYRYDENHTRFNEKGQGIVHGINRRACSVPRNDNLVFCGYRSAWWHQDNWPTARKQGCLDEVLARRTDWSAHIDNQYVMHRGAIDHSFAK